MPQSVFALAVCFPQVFQLFETNTMNFARLHKCDSNRTIVRGGIPLAKVCLRTVVRLKLNEYIPNFVVPKVINSAHTVFAFVFASLVPVSAIKPKRQPSKEGHLHFDWNAFSINFCAAGNKMISVFVSRRLQVIRTLLNEKFGFSFSQSVSIPHNNLKKVEDTDILHYSIFHTLTNLG